MGERKLTWVFWFALLFSACSVLPPPPPPSPEDPASVEAPEGPIRTTNGYRPLNPPEPTDTPR